MGNKPTVAADDKLTAEKERLERLQNDSMCSDCCLNCFSEGKSTTKCLVAFLVAAIFLLLAFY